jgi:hypothetical protein
MTFEILLKKPEIDYDISMTARLIMLREIAGGATPEQGFNVANTQDEAGEVNLVNRYIEDAVNKLIEALGRYLPEITPNDNDLAGTEVESFRFPFTVPDNFNRVYIGSLRSAMHRFIVNRVLFDWFLKTKPNEAAGFEVVSNEALTDILSCMNRRTGFTRIKPYPPF